VRIYWKITTSDRASGCLISCASLQMPQSLLLRFGKGMLAANPPPNARAVCAARATASVITLLPPW
jgi:hypothetical protein